MTLDNLLGMSLERIDADPLAIQRLLEAAQRNVADYSGDLVADSAVAECIDQAKLLWMKVSEWLNHEHPELLK